MAETMYLPREVVMGLGLTKAAENNAGKIKSTQQVFATVNFFLICYFKSAKDLKTT